MTELGDLEGQSFGPYPLRICLEKVKEFTEATGTDAERWVEAAPPAFLSLALFVVAPELLDRLSGHTVIHGDQSYSWNGPLGMERDVSVTGTVSRVRERADTHFVTFDLQVTDADGGALAAGTSLFLVSPEVAGSTTTATPASDAVSSSSPAANVADRGSVGEGQRSASRADLVRYAAATRDWNPIHWDHDAALSAGLDGVITHGLLQAAWALDAAAEGTTGIRPFAEAKIRFRSPLPPATPVEVSVDRGDTSRDVTISAGDTVYLTARATVTDE